MKNRLLDEKRLPLREEAQLCRRMTELHHTPNPTNDQVQELREITGRLIESHSPWIMTTIRECKRPPWIDVDEIFADVMLDILKSVSKYNPNISQFNTFLYTVVMRSAKRSIQRFMKYSSNEELTPDMALLPPENNTYPHEILKDILWACKELNIPERQQKIMRRKLSGRTNEDVAAELNTTPSEIVDEQRYIYRQIATFFLSRHYEAAPYITTEKLQEIVDEKISWEKNNPRLCLPGD